MDETLPRRATHDEILEYVFAEDDKTVAKLALFDEEVRGQHKATEVSYRQGEFLLAVASRAEELSEEAGEIAIGALQNLNEARRLAARALKDEPALVDVDNVLKGIKTQRIDGSADSGGRVEEGASRERLIKGEVDLDQFRHIAYAQGYTPRTALTAWNTMVYLTTRPLLSNPNDKAPLFNELPVASGAQFHTQNGVDVTNSEYVKVDSEAFITATDYIRSFGSRYTDELEGIRHLLRGEPASNYRTYRMWRDFAGHCISENAKDAKTVEINGHKSELAQSHDRLWNKVKDFNKEPEFLRWVAGHEPFVIHLKSDGKVTPFNFDFVESHKETIFSRFPHAQSAMSRIYSLLARKQVFYTNMDETNRERWGIVQKGEDPESNLADSVLVTDPRRFFEQAFAITNFGISTAKALLAAVYIQAEEASMIQDTDEKTD